MDDTTSRDHTTGRRRTGLWMFLTEAARDLRTVGAVAPSGAALARALAQPLRTRASQPLTVLEVGAGTGAVTGALISALSPGSRLDVVEANPRFAPRLRQLVATHPDLAGRTGHARVHHTRIEDLDTTRRYDVIVSGLPLTNFTTDQVETIMERYLRLLHPDGVLTYFAYRATRAARVLLASRDEARRHRGVDRVMTGYQRRYAIGCTRIWANVPPATVWQLQHPAHSCLRTQPNQPAPAASPASPPSIPS